MTVGPEEPRSVLDGVSGANSARLRAGERYLRITDDLVNAILVAADAQEFRLASAAEGVAHSVTRTTALVGASVIDDRVSELGKQSGIAWKAFLEGAGLDRWTSDPPRSPPDREDDAPFHGTALQAIDVYAERYGTQRPKLDPMGLCWGLLESPTDDSTLTPEVRFHDRILAAGGNPEEFRSLVEAELDESLVRIAVEPETPIVDDRVGTLTDAPAVVDLLNRKPLAESIAIRFRETRTDDPETSFVLHVDGPWGAGKSTLLNFLRSELESDSLVLYFNAWREQHAGPPWWGLLGALRRGALQDGGWRFRARESLARVRSLGLRFWLVALAALVVTVSAFAWAASGAPDLTALGSAAASIAAILALGGTVWTITARLGRSRAPGSLNAATKYVESQENPMQGVANQFNEVVRLVDKPVVIFVDDLDRCSTSYVVEFLEAVQTLIRDGPRSAGQSAPYFVVAADGRWIRASYEKEYSDFSSAVFYPGRPLGYLFLDKAFQLTTTLPAIDEDLRMSYWEILLGTQKSVDATAGLEAAARIAKEALEGATTDAEVLDRLEAQGQDDPFLRSAFRGEAVRTMARADVASSTEHALRDYADLLDPNPRAMKRFVNAYSVERALRTIEARRPELDQLARWTIVHLRWPQLADVLRKEPHLVVFIGSDPLALADSDREAFGTVTDLLLHPDVVRTITDVDPKYGQPLTDQGIVESAGL